jgi:hypothetical protein
LDGLVRYIIRFVLDLFKPPRIRHHVINNVQLKFTGVLVKEIKKKNCPKDYEAVVVRGAHVELLVWYKLRSNPLQMVIGVIG